MIGITKLPRLLILISWIHISRQYNYIHGWTIEKNRKFFKISSEKFPFAWEVKQRVLSAPLSFRTLYKFIANFFLVPCTSKPWNLLKLSSPTWGRGGRKIMRISLSCYAIFWQFLLLSPLPLHLSSSSTYFPLFVEIFTGRFQGRGVALTSRKLGCKLQTIIHPLS